MTRAKLWVIRGVAWSTLCLTKVIETAHTEVFRTSQLADFALLSVFALALVVSLAVLLYDVFRFVRRRGFVGMIKLALMVALALVIPYLFYRDLLGFGTVFVVLAIIAVKKGWLVIRAAPPHEQPGGLHRIN